MESIILKNGILITPFEKMKNISLFLKDGKIEKIVRQIELQLYSKKYINDYRVINVGGNYISPGLIDIHTHGANDTGAVNDSIIPMCEFKVKHGTTGFFPTLLTVEFDRMVNACSRISDLMNTRYNGSKILGINSEGPYLNPEFGAQKKEFTRNPIFKDYSRLVEAGNGNLRLMTVAPELEGSKELIRYLRENNVVVSIGHTNISMEAMDEAIGWGITMVTHILNALGDSVHIEKGVKAVGIQEKMLIEDNLMSEIISDKNGVHVKPELLDIVLRCKGIDNLILITDSMNMTGLPPGQYSLEDGRTIFTDDNSDVVRLENRVIAGSIMTMEKTVKNFIKHTGTDLKDAIRMATYNPAKAVGIAYKKGEIKEGMDADVVVFDQDLNIKFTIVEGSLEYSK